jgi:predicted dehydrogenase
MRWGLLGTARINRAIVPVLQASSRNTLEAVASRAADRARVYAAEWRIPRALAPYEALLSDPGIDAVYISLPNTLHADWTIRALEAGKHVLCEKPLALTVDDVDGIADASARTGRVAAEAFMYRHHPITDAALAAVRGGKIGTLQLIKGAFTFQLAGREPDIRLDPALGGGSLWDVGCYPVSYSCLFAGAAPTAVLGWQQTTRDGIDLSFAGMMRFPGGVVAQFDSGFQTMFRAEMEIVGSEGVLRVERPFKTMPESRLLLTRGDETTALAFRRDPPYVGEIEDFAATVLDGVPQRVPLAESRRTVHTICALYAAARAR